MKEPSLEELREGQELLCLTDTLNNGPRQGEKVVIGTIVKEEDDDAPVQILYNNGERKGWISWPADSFTAHVDTSPFTLLSKEERKEHICKIVDELYKQPYLYKIFEKAFTHHEQHTT